MTEQPKRRAWFQLHLSTCVVLMVVAGAGLFLNTIEFSRVITIDEEATVTYGDGVQWELPLNGQQMGWPWRYRTVGDSEITTFYPHSHTVTRSTYSEFSMTALVGDLAVGLGVIAGVGLLCECLIRRRERKRIEIKYD